MKRWRRLILLGFLVGSGPLRADTWHGLSNILAIGLPVTAGALSVVHDDASGLLQLVKAEASSLVISEALKQTVHERRPNGRDDKSFPSGHTAVAFSAAQYLQQRGGWEYGVPAYALAGVVAYSRVKADEHYWRDVAAGAVIGIGSSLFFNDPSQNQSFSVWFGGDGPRATYQKRW